MLQLQKASRKKAKIRLGLSAIAGGGKTYSALLIAYGLCGDWNKIAIIDSENESASLYADLGGYNTIVIRPPFTPEKYIEAIKVCEDEGMEVTIIDSVTHEWDGAGGCLDIVEDLTKKDPKHNSYTQWRFVTPRHQAFLDAILQSKCHIITTVRRKQDYEMTKNSDGKVTVTKAGLKEITRDGFEYELTVNIELDQNHNATSSKDRTGLFQDKPAFTPSVETGKLIKQWCETGVEAPSKSNGKLGYSEPPNHSDKELAAMRQPLPTNNQAADFYDVWQKEVSAMDTKNKLMELYNAHKSTIMEDEMLKEMFKHKQSELTKLVTGV